MRRVLWVVLVALLAVVFAMLLLAGWYAFAYGSANPFGDAAHRLFLFTDVGIAAWLVALIVFAVRGRFDFTRVFVAAILGAALNGVVVLIVGLIQRGEPPVDFLIWAAEGGVAFVLASLAAGVVAPAIVRPR